MVIRKVSLKEFPKALGQAYADIQTAQKAVVAEAIIDYLPQIIQESPIDTGLFAQSWDLLETEKTIILGNYAPHSSIIEYGARPFIPPIKPLLEWAKRVLKDPSQPPDYSNSVWALAIHTRTQISIRGFEPKHILENAIPEIINNIKMKLEAM